MVVIVKGEGLAEGVKRKMIEQAALSLASKGLQRTSFTQVLEASGAPRGSLYHHFPGGKDELILAALDLAGEWALRKFAGPSGRSPTQVAEGFVELWRSVLLYSDFGAGCAVAAVAIAAEAPDLLVRAAAIFRKWRERLAAQLVQGGIDEPRATALANLLIAACEGAVILARAEHSMKSFEQAMQSLILLISEAVESGTLSRF